MKTRDEIERGICGSWPWFLSATPDVTPACHGGAGAVDADIKVDVAGVAAGAVDITPADAVFAGGDADITAGITVASAGVGIGVGIGVDVDVDSGVDVEVAGSATGTDTASGASTSVSAPTPGPAIAPVPDPDAAGAAISCSHSSIFCAAALSALSCLARSCSSSVLPILSNTPRSRSQSSRLSPPCTCHFSTGSSRGLSYSTSCSRQ